MAKSGTKSVLLRIPETVDRGLSTLAMLTERSKGEMVEELLRVYLASKPNLAEELTAEIQQRIDSIRTASA